MGFVQSKIEDTKEEHLELAVTAFGEVPKKALRWIEKPLAKQDS